MKASTQTKTWEVTLNTLKAKKYLNVIEAVPGVESARTWKDTRNGTVYLVKTKKKQTSKYLKRNLPYVESVVKHNGTITPPKPIYVSEDSDSSDDILKWRATVKVQTRNQRTLTTSGYFKLEAMADARLQRELEDIEIEMQIGFSVDCGSDDDYNNTKPLKKYFKDDFEPLKYGESVESQKKKNIEKGVDFFNDPSRYYQ